MSNLKNVNSKKARWKTIENAFSGMVMTNCAGDVSADLGTITIDAQFSNQSNEIVTVTNQSEIIEDEDPSLTELTIKTRFIPLDALRIMYKGRLDVYNYVAGNLFTWSDTLIPWERSNDPECLTQCYPICHPFCDKPTVSVTYQLGKADPIILSEGTDYTISMDVCNKYRVIKRLNATINIKGKLNITYNGNVADWCNRKWNGCSSRSPFILRLTAHNGKCAEAKEVSFDFEATAKPFQFTPTVNAGEKAMYEFVIRWRRLDNLYL